MFLAKKFVLKHIRTKFEAKVQEERDKVWTGEGRGGGGGPGVEEKCAVAGEG